MGSNCCTSISQALLLQGSTLFCIYQPLVNRDVNHQTFEFTLDVATYPSRVASTGVLHGEAAKANVSPARYACTPSMSRFSKLKFVRSFSQPTFLLTTEAHNSVDNYLMENQQQQPGDQNCQKRMAAVVQLSAKLRQC